MYRKAFTIPTVFIAAIVTMGALVPMALAQDPEEVPQIDQGPAAPAAPDAPTKAKEHDYTRMQAAGLLSTPKPVQAVAFSPDGQLLAAISFQEAYLWDTSTGTALRAIGLPQGSFARAMAWSPDAQTLAIGGGGQSGSVSLWNPRAGTQVRAFAPGVFLGSLAYSPDGSIIAGGALDKKVRLWSAATGEEIATLSGPEFPISSLSFSADGSVLYAIGGGTGKLIEAANAEGDGGMGAMPGGMAPGTYEGMTDFTSWSVADKTPLSHVILKEGSPNVAFSPDKLMLAVVGPDGIQSQNEAGGPRRMQVLWPAGTVRLWQVPQAGEAGNADAFLPQVLKNPTATPREKIAVAFSPDGKVGVIDNFLWNGGEAPIPLPRGNMNEFTSLAFSPDGSFLAASGAAGVQVWSVPDAGPQTGQPGPVRPHGPGGRRFDN